MAMREKHKALVRLFWRRLSMAALLLLTIGAGFAVWNVSQKERESRALRERAELQRRDLVEQESSLSEHIQRLKTEKGKEEVLREQYGVARAGEELIVIVEPEVPEPAAKEPTVREWVRKFLPFW